MLNDLQKHESQKRIVSYANWMGGVGYALGMFMLIAGIASREDFTVLSIPTFLSFIFAMTAFFFVQKGARNFWGGVLVFSGIGVFLSFLYTVSANEMFSFYILPVMLVFSLPFMISGGLFILSSKEAL